MQTRLKMTQTFHAGKEHYIRMSSYYAPTQWCLSETDQQIFIALRYPQVKGEIVKVKTQRMDREQTVVL